MSKHPINVDELVDSLTLAEQVSLLAGRNIWETEAIARVGIPSIRVSDGPVGARGTDFNGPASVNTPCGTSLAATFDPDAGRRDRPSARQGDPGQGRPRAARAHGQPASHPDRRPKLRVHE